MDLKSQPDTQKPSFEFRDKIESWVEGVFSTLDVYCRTVVRIHLHPLRSSSVIQVDAANHKDFSQPGIYMVISYMIMLTTIRQANFSDPVFLADLSRILNAVGVLEALKTLNVESIIASIVPAIGLLFYFVYTHRFILFLLRDKSDRAVIRRAYCYILGTMYLLVGSIYSAYTFIAKPLQPNHPRLAYTTHVLSFWPMIGVITLVVLVLQRGEMGAKGLWRRAIATTLVWTILIKILSYFSGNEGLFDYTRSTQ